MTEKKRAVDRNKAKNRHFIAAIKALIYELNEERKEERRRLGLVGRFKRESYETLAARVGRQGTVFHNIRVGREPPTFRLIKAIAAGLHWHEFRVFEWVQILLEAMGRDLKKISVGYDPENPKVAERIKLVIRDVAIELMEQNKEEK